MIPRRSELYTSAVDDLRSCAEGLVRVAQALTDASNGLETEQPELLRQQAIGVQAESMRAAMAALTARGVAERLALVARIDEDMEAMSDG